MKQVHTLALALLLGLSRAGVAPGRLRRQRGGCRRIRGQWENRHPLPQGQQ